MKMLRASACLHILLTVHFIQLSKTGLVSAFALLVLLEMLYKLLLAFHINPGLTSLEDRAHLMFQRLESEAMSDAIRIQGAHTHNLKHITVTIPRNKLVVMTGVSGSGKSTLLFDILHKESQRQFMGAHGIVTDQLQKAHVEKIIGLSPSVLST